MKKISTSLVLLLFIFACQTDNKDRQSTKVNAGEAVEQPKTEEDGYLFEGCFQLEETNGENKTITFIILEIEGSNVSGEEAIEMTGPEYQAVAAGSFEGNINGDVLTVLYTYEIDGNEQIEEQEFKLTESGLVMSDGPREDKGGVMTLTNKGLFNKSIPKIDCP